MASGQSPNSSNLGLVAASSANTTAIVAHPEYIYYRPEWRKLRDVIAGERQIKLQTELYLRKLKKQDLDDYKDYLDGASFYNMTFQTLNGMIGEVFQRDPSIENLPAKFKDKIRFGLGKDGSGHVGFSKSVITEILSMGRYGVLVDAPAVASIVPTSFAIGYLAENILDWEVAEVNGTYRLTRVFLREFTRNDEKAPGADNAWIGRATAQRVKAGSTPDRQASGYTAAFTYQTSYRELFLELQDDGSYVYKQNVYPETVDSSPTTFTPTVRGKTLDFIPFMFFGATGNTAEVEKSPLSDIADLNISHYRTYAQLEWGRMFTALPVYYAPGRDDEGASEYCIGPSVVWEVPAEADPPGILEYKGEGLKQLESALNTKERQIAAIGGRLMPGSQTKGSESPEQAKRAQISEQALILNAIQSTEFGMTMVVRWWLMWRDVPLVQTEDLAYNMNRAFGANAIGAREMRVMQQLYNDGIMPIDAVYLFSVKGGWIDPDMSLEDFKALLDDENSFVNSPDAQARQRGYANRAQELDHQSSQVEEDQQQQEIDLQEREVDLMEETAQQQADQGTPGGTAPPAPPAAASAALPARPSGQGTRPGKGSKQKKPTK
jgi:hypothetical protein